MRAQTVHTARAARAQHSIILTRTTGSGHRLETGPLESVLEKVRESNDESTLADKRSHTVLTVDAEIPRSLVSSLISRTRFRFRSLPPEIIISDHTAKLTAGSEIGKRS